MSKNFAILGEVVIFSFLETVWAQITKHLYSKVLTNQKIMAGSGTNDVIAKVQGNFKVSKLDQVWYH